MPTLSIVITSFNDKGIIMPYYEAIVDVLKNQNKYDWELIYVDDGSTDGSVEILKDLTTKDERVVFIELAKNFGQQKAFFAGMKQARGDAIITIDGDYQYGPECIINLADKIFEGHDIVSGIRHPRCDPLFSRLASFIGQYFVRRSLPFPIKDFGAVKAFSRFLNHKIIKYENYCIMPYGIAFALTNRIAEILVQHRPRPIGVSKWTFTKRLHVYFDLFLAYSPFESNSLIRIGALAVIVGMLILTCLLYLFLVHDVFLFQTFRSAIALFFIGGGIALIFGSIFLSFFLRIYRQLFWQGECYVTREIYSSAKSSNTLNISNG